MWTSEEYALKIIILYYFIYPLRERTCIINNVLKHKFNSEGGAGGYYVWNKIENPKKRWKK